jgi:membrane fusion protein (multidrug efflux system)
MESLRNTKAILLLVAIGIGITLHSCKSSSANPEMQPQQAPTLPVIAVSAMPAVTYKEFSATLEGKVNVEIRAQVDGYIEKIYVDEGAYVKAGQPLFKINDRIYNEQLDNAKATLQAAKANLEKSQVELDRLSPLVKNNVISDVQLRTAQSGYDAAKAAVSQAQAMVGNAKINVGYTLITAPVSGYIGRIPFKTGSLVGRGETLPLTVLSDVNEVYAYFSMSEMEFLEFASDFEGSTIQEKVKKLPPVELMLADNSILPEKGKISTVEGQFDKTIGAISFRATFPNKGGLLRSGNTGRVRIPKQHSTELVIPQEATFELQDKVFVFAVADSNKVISKPISISGKSGTYYFVEKGIEPGEKIVYSGLDRLKDGAAITPQVLSTDSLIKAKPL